MINSSLELVVAGTADAVLMVESEAKELSEEAMLGAVMFGQRECRRCRRDHSPCREGGQEPRASSMPGEHEAAQPDRAAPEGDLKHAYQIAEKAARRERTRRDQARSCCGLLPAKKKARFRPPASASCSRNWKAASCGAR